MKVSAMKQTFDLTSTVPTNSPRTIVFAKTGMGLRGYSEYSYASQIEEHPDNHQGHFGCDIKGLGMDRISVASVEHARLLIKALEFAIANDFLFTESQLAKHLTSAIDTRRSIKEKIRNEK